MFVWRRWLEEQSRLQHYSGKFSASEDSRQNSDPSEDAVADQAQGTQALSETQTSSGSGCKDDWHKMRTSDSDRQQVVEWLRGALEDGRLTMEEYADRVGLADQAVTYGELAVLCADLPTAGLTVAGQKTNPEATPRERGGRPRRRNRLLRDISARQLMVNGWLGHGMPRPRGPQG